MYMSETKNYTNLSLIHKSDGNSTCLYSPFSSDFVVNSWRIFLLSNTKPRMSSLVITKCWKFHVMFDALVTVMTFKSLPLSSLLSCNVTSLPYSPFLPIKDFWHNVTPCDFFNNSGIIIQLSNFTSAQVLAVVLPVCHHIYMSSLSLSNLLLHSSFGTILGLWKQVTV